VDGAITCYGTTRGLASELAYLFGEDHAVTRWLRIDERKQAKAQGIKLTRRP
jgi:hypothetical protein